MSHFEMNKPQTFGGSCFCYTMFTLVIMVGAQLKKVGVYPWPSFKKLICWRSSLDSPTTMPPQWIVKGSLTAMDWRVYVGHKYNSYSLTICLYCVNSLQKIKMKMR